MPMRRIIAAAAFASLSVGGPAMSQDWSRANRARLLAPDGVAGALCYDAVAIATPSAYANTESLADLSGDAWVGARSDVYVSVQSVPLGQLPGRRLWVRLIESSAHQYGAARVFLLRRIDDDHYWAVDWAYRQQARDQKLLDPATGWLPPACAPTNEE